MKHKKLSLVVGARPNFVKAAPLLEKLSPLENISVQLIHTGQHFDAEMSTVFFDQLGMQEPDLYLGINQGGPIQQIAESMIALEREFIKNKTDLVIVFGDVNSTLAASLVASKLQIALAHVEAGLRSYDREMPEEHNRVATDHLSNYLFTPSPDADQNLIKEGIAKEKIFRVGNIMVDSLLKYAPIAQGEDILKDLNLDAQGFGLVTLHRPANVDEVEALNEILSALMEIGRQLPLIFPVHPRTRKKLDAWGLTKKMAQNGIKLTEPLGYLQFMKLLMSAKVVLTDSGGIQEESTVLGIPCLTLRDNTERPITISEGTNLLAGTKGSSILTAYKEAMSQRDIEGKSIDLWDGQTAARIVDVLKAL